MKKGKKFYSYMEYIIGLAPIIFCLVIFAVIILWLIIRNVDFRFETGKERAGRKGERIATQLIQEVLDDSDILLTNIHLSFDGSETELDNVVINSRGVFIVEVKNYSGILAGKADDYKWLKSKYTDAGNFYQMEVKNPIKQVKRQVYILSSVLKEHRIRVWVEGYAFLLQQNSPVDDEHILRTQRDIHEAIHLKTNNKLSKETQKKIVDILARYDH